MKNIIETKNAPEPIGPYSQAVLANGTLYISGQISMDPLTGELITNNINEETQRVMENIKAILTAANMGFENVIKTTIFLLNMEDFSIVNSVYGSFFNSTTAPARETVQVSKLPKNVNVEISVIATK